MTSMKRISRLARFAVAAYCFLPVASVSVGGAAAECPDLDLVDRTWVEHAARPRPMTCWRLIWPRRARARHRCSCRSLRRTTGSVSPCAIPMGSIRPALSCYLLGSVAYTTTASKGTRNSTWSKEISEGREPQLRDRLVELRWFDPKENKKHRWFNVALARSLGWFTYANGTQDENLRPIPLPPVPNSLDIAQAAGARQQPDSNPKPERNAPTGVIESARNWGDALLDKKED